MNVLGGKGLYISFTIAPLKRRRRPCSDIFCKSTSRGNRTVCSEFNFAADPEAAYIVLNDYQCPTYLACWEFTCSSKLSWARLYTPCHIHSWD